MKTQEECLTALVLGCTLIEEEKGYTVQLYRGKQLKTNPLRQHKHKDYRFNSPESWSIKYKPMKYKLLHRFI